jgi:hypothetical protein
MLGKLVQIANGRRRRGTCALRRSTGAAVAYANLLIGSRKSISAAVRVRMQFGMQVLNPRSPSPDNTRKAHTYVRIQKKNMAQQCVAPKAYGGSLCFASAEPD